VARADPRRSPDPPAGSGTPPRVHECRRRLQASRIETGSAHPHAGVIAIAMAAASTPISDRG
jgi:hypothetical protein